MCPPIHVVGTPTLVGSGSPPAYPSDVIEEATLPAEDQAHQQYQGDLLGDPLGQGDQPCEQQGEGERRPLRKKD